MCGDNGVIYSNACSLKVAECLLDMDIRVVECGQANPSAAVVVEETSPAADEANVEIFCEVTGSPVCGTDNVTYGNECNLKATATLLNLDIEVKHSGRCDPTKPAASES